MLNTEYLLTYGLCLKIIKMGATEIKITSFGSLRRTKINP